MSEVSLTIPTPYELARAFPDIRFLAFTGSHFVGGGERSSRAVLFRTFDRAENAALGADSVMAKQHRCVLLLRIADLLPVLDHREGMRFAKRPLVGRVEGEDEEQVATRMIEAWGEYRETCGAKALPRDEPRLVDLAAKLIDAIAKSRAVPRELAIRATEIINDVMEATGATR